MKRSKGLESGMWHVVIFPKKKTLQILSCQVATNNTSILYSSHFALTNINKKNNVETLKTKRAKWAIPPQLNYSKAKKLNVFFIVGDKRAEYICVCVCVVIACSASYHLFSFGFASLHQKSTQWNIEPNHGINIKPEP